MKLLKQFPQYWCFAGLLIIQIIGITYFVMKSRDVVV